MKPGRGTSRGAHDCPLGFLDILFLSGIIAWVAVWVIFKFIWK